MYVPMYVNLCVYIHFKCRYSFMSPQRLMGAPVCMMDRCVLIMLFDSFCAALNAAAASCTRGTSRARDCGSAAARIPCCCEYG